MYVLIISLIALCLPCQLSDLRILVNTKQQNAPNRLLAESGEEFIRSAHSVQTTVSVRATRMFAQRAELINSAYSSLRNISTNIDYINKAIKYLDSLEPSAFFC